MKKAIALLLSAFMLISFAGCESEPAQTTTTTTAPDPSKIEVPDFSELSWEQIEMMYPKLNITPEYEYSDEIAEGNFISQSPNAGEKIDKDAEITVKFSNGSKLVEVDDYTGRNIDDAQTLIEKQGLKCEIIRVENEDVTENCIISTEPAARTKLEKGSTVICYVSMGGAEEELKVPAFIGKTIEEATDIAKDYKISLTISYDDESDEPVGTVISQSVEKGTVVTPNMKIEVVISGEKESKERKTTIVVAIREGLSGEYKFKYYIDGTLVDEKTEIKEMSLTKAIAWEVTGEEVHTYTVRVTCLETGKTGTLYEVEVDFTQDTLTQDHKQPFNAEIFEKLKNPEYSE